MECQALIHVGYTRVSSQAKIQRLQISLCFFFSSNMKNYNLLQTVALFYIETRLLR